MVVSEEKDVELSQCSQSGMVRAGESGEVSSSDRRGRRIANLVHFQDLVAAHLDTLATNSVVTRHVFLRR